MLYRARVSWQAEPPTGGLSHCSKCQLVIGQGSHSSAVGTTDYPNQQHDRRQVVIQGLSPSDFCPWLAPEWRRLGKHRWRQTCYPRPLTPATHAFHSQREHYGAKGRATARSPGRCSNHVPSTSQSQQILVHYDDWWTTDPSDRLSESWTCQTIFGLRATMPRATISSPGPAIPQLPLDQEGEYREHSGATWTRHHPVARSERVHLAGDLAGGPGPVSRGQAADL